MGRGSSFGFTGPELNSYATTIARIYMHKGARLVLMDSASFSPSTAKHQSYLRRALRECDANVSVEFGRRGQSLRFTPKQIWEALIAECQDYATQASKARGRAPFLLDCARGSVVKAEQVRKFFGMRNKPFAPDLSKLVEYAKGEAVKRADMEARKEKARAKALQTFAPRMLILWRAHGEGSFEWQQLRDAMTVSGNSGLNVGALISTPEFAGTAALRLNADRSRVETSQHAQVLVRTVSFLWAFCRNAKAKGEAVDTQTVARFPRLDNYNANAIDAGGNLTAGCHRIPFAEIEGIARALGLPPFNGQPAEAPTIPDAAATHAEDREFALNGYRAAQGGAS